MDVQQQIYSLLGHRTEISDIIMVSMLIMMRMLPIIFLTPFLGGRLVPPETKMALSMGMALLSYNYAIEQMHGEFSPNPFVYLGLMLKETFIGFVIGFIAAEVWYMMDIAGRLLDTMRGSSMLEIQIPELQARASPFGAFLFHLMLIFFMAIGGHLLFIEAVLESFRVVPLDVWPSFQGNFQHWVLSVLLHTGKLYEIGFALVFPGCFCTFMIDLAFGMMNKVAPQLNAYQLANGIKPLAAMGIFIATTTMVIQEMDKLSGEFLEFLNRMIVLMN